MALARARFFYALRPDALAAKALAAIAAQAAAKWGGHAFAAPDIHLTLAFVGMQPIEQRPALQAILQGLPARFDVSGAPRPRADADEAGGSGVDPPPALALSRLGSFGHGVLWIGPASRTDHAAPARGFPHALAQEIRSRLRAAQIAFDARPLKLHATIVRGARGFGDESRSESAEATGASGGGASGIRRPAAASSTIDASLPIVARAWSLALGASDGASTPSRRYRWWTSTAPASEE
ncbi:MAG: hypothetical protein LT102_11930 [Burkholderiaceae bacterium]|nr:hypothetical protein [Burkholderiaceae bacterium]